MTDPMHQQLLGHLLGALDDDEQEWLESRLEQDEEYRRQWMCWRRRLAPLLTERPEFEPPPGLAEQTCRLVAACAPMLVFEEKPRPTMRPVPTLPGGAAGARWLDAAVVAAILLAVVALVPPAIHGSRFHCRLASCQDKLRQVGLALTQYGHDHHDALSELAADERLTGAGAFAAGMLGDEFAGEDRSAAMFPVAWLAAQGALRGTIGWQNGFSRQKIDQSPPLPFPITTSESVSSFKDWSGAWGNETADGPENLSPAAVPVLADVAGADVPGQGINFHGGRGRNQFFEDGHVNFLPCSAPRGAAETILSNDGSCPRGPIPPTAPFPLARIIHE